MPSVDKCFAEERKMVEHEEREDWTLLGIGEIPQVTKGHSVGRAIIHVCDICEGTLCWVIFHLSRYKFMDQNFVLSTRQECRCKSLYPISKISIM